MAPVTAGTPILATALRLSLLWSERPLLDALDCWPPPLAWLPVAAF